MTLVDFHVVKKIDGSPFVGLSYEIVGGVTAKKSITNDEGYTEVHWLSISKSYTIKLEGIESLVFTPQRLFIESIKIAVT